MVRYRLHRESREEANKPKNTTQMRVHLTNCSNHVATITFCLKHRVYIYRYRPNLLRLDFFAIKDWAGPCSKSKSSFTKRRHENSCKNFEFRLFYKFLLEFCFFVLISLSFYDFGEFSTDYSYSISILLVLLVGLVFLYCICSSKRSQRWGLYKKNTALKDTWGVCEINHYFDTLAYLKANKKRTRNVETGLNL